MLYQDDNAAGATIGGAATLRYSAKWLSGKGVTRGDRLAPTARPGCAELRDRALEPARPRAGRTGTSTSYLNVDCRLKRLRSCAGEDAERGTSAVAAVSSARTGSAGEAALGNPLLRTAATSAGAPRIGEEKGITERIAQRLNRKLACIARSSPLLVRNTLRPASAHCSKLQLSSSKKPVLRSLLYFYCFAQRHLQRRCAAWLSGAPSAKRDCS